MEDGFVERFNKTTLVGTLGLLGDNITLYKKVELPVIVEYTKDIKGFFEKSFYESETSEGFSMANSFPIVRINDNDYKNTDVNGDIITFSVGDRVITGGISYKIVDIQSHGEGTTTFILGDEYVAS